MDLTYAAILVLAAMTFLLSGMIGYLYWMQTRLQQHVQSLSIIVSSLATPQPAELEEAAPTPESVAEVELEVDDVSEDDEDDRISVERVSAPPASEQAPTAPESPPVDIDDLQSKTAVQLREMLTQKGIPFGKRDSKSALIELLKATA